MTRPTRVPWPVRTVRSPDGRLYISVDCLMDLRNKMGTVGWPAPAMALVDHIIREAKRTDTEGDDVT
jgi:hypothetical protein